MSENIIEMKDIRKSFYVGTPNQLNILKGIDITVKKGEFVSIVGQSGSGKSTLMNIIGALDRATSGSYILSGTNIEDITDDGLSEVRNKKIGFVFQTYNLIPRNTVLKNVELPMLYAGVPAKERTERAMYFLEMVGMKDRIKHQPNELSGGQKQRVAIARALATNPKILLCDEATSALDPTTTKAILALLKEINEKYGITIVIITHEMAVVQEICSHVAIIDEGSLAETGTVEEVFSRPKSKAAKKLVFRGEEKHYDEMRGKRCIRIVFSSNSSYEPVIANMVLACNAPVNILLADTQDIGGVAHGQMILQLPEEEVTAEKMIQYLKNRKLEVEELDNYVG